MNNSTKPRISIKEIFDDIHIYENEKNVDVLKKRIEELKEDNLIHDQEPDYVEVLNKCLEWVTNYVFHLPEKFVEEQLILRMLLFLFSERKINVLGKENLESNDLRVKLINNGCKIVKFCIEAEYFIHFDYFISRTRETISDINEFYKEHEQFNKQILNKKIELMLYNTEKMLKQNRLLEAMEELNRQKDCVIMLNTYHEYYVGLCYNISLKCIQDNNHEYAFTILLLAYDICKVAKQLSSNMKTILQFLVYTCWNYHPNKNWLTAINVLELANRDEIDIFYIIGKIKFALVAKAQNVLEEALNQATEWKNLKINDVYQIVQLLQKNDLTILAADFVQTLQYKPFSTNDKFLLMKLEIQIYISANDSKLSSILDNAIEYISNASINENSVLNLCKLLTKSADLKFKEKIFNESLNLYGYSIKVLELKRLCGSILRHIKTQMCLCYIEVDDWKSARNTFEELQKNYSKDDPLYVFIALQVAFMNDDEKLAEDALIGCGKENKIFNSYFRNEIFSGFFENINVQSVKK